MVRATARFIINLIGTIITIFLVFLVVDAYSSGWRPSFMESERIPQQVRDFAKQVDGVASPEMICDQPFPDGGRIAYAQTLEHSIKAMSDLRIRNKYNRPIDLHVYAGRGSTDGRGANPVMRVAMNAGGDAFLNVSAGEYSFAVSSGTSWCGAEHGFKQGQLKRYRGGLNLEPGRDSLVTIAGQGQGDHSLTISKPTHAASRDISRPPVFGRGFMDLQRAADGHFYVTGSLDGFPVVFLLDTGASKTSVNQRVAKNMNMTRCEKQRFITADGSVNGCVGAARSLVVGFVEFSNVNVAVMPNMADMSLLGSDVLRQFHIEQSGDTMRLIPN